LPERQRQRLVHVFNKADAAPAGCADMALAALAALSEDSRGLALSAKTHAGLQTLRETLLVLAGWHASPEGVFIARTRHLKALRQAQHHLAQARGWAAQADTALDLLAEELRLAHDALGAITGAYTPDDLLGDIFTRFCIGK
jgi:tRNA modification GTPase